MAKAKQKMTAEDIKKYAFWSLCVVALLLPVVVTFLAVKAVAAKFEEQKAALETTMSNVRGVSSNQTHPNETLIEQIDQLTQEQTQKVMAAWARLEADQKRRNVWPSDLGGPFLRMIAEKKHGDDIEQIYLEHYFQFMRYRIPKMLDEVGARKQQYKKFKINPDTNEIEFEKDEDGNDIWVDVNPNWGIDQPTNTAGTGANTGFGGSGMGGAAGRGGNPGAGMGASPSGTGGAGGGMFGGMSGGPGGFGGPAGGSSGSGGIGGFGGGGAPSAIGGAQGTGGYVLSEHVRWVGGVDWPNPEIFQLQPQGVPQPIQIWYMQEDLWVYDALLWVIKETNRVTDESAKNLAETHHKSPIKQITHLLIGKNAATAMGQLKIIEGIAGLGTSAGMGGSSSMPSSEGSGGSMDSGTGGPGGTGTQVNLATMGAYGWNVIDPDVLKTHILQYRYLDAELSPLDATSEPPFKEFNRMPVILRLIVDQRSITEVLANCANSAMPIDVLHVRINPAKAGPVELPSALSGTGGMDMGSGSSSDSTTTSMTMGGGGMNDPFSSGGIGGVGGGSAGGVESGTGGFQVSGSVGVYNSESIVVEIFGIINIFNSADHSAMAASLREAEEERRRAAEEAQRQAEAAAALAPDEAASVSDEEANGEATGEEEMTEEDIDVILSPDADSGEPSNASEQTSEPAAEIGEQTPIP